MTFHRFLSKSFSWVLLMTFTALSLHLPVAQATIIGTDKVIQQQLAAQKRDQVLDLFIREDVAKEMQSMGVTPEEVQARLNALSDDEILALHERMSEHPAGAGALGAVVFVFLVLLVTDIMGYTDVFPFVTKTAQ